MRLTKSLLCGISALVLGTGGAFAGEELLSAEPMMDEYALEEGDVIYIYPMEVTEYYLVIPSESGEMPG